MVFLSGKRQRWGRGRTLLLLFGTGVLVIALAGWWAVENVLPYAIVGTRRVHRNVTPQRFGLRSASFSLETEPGIRLQGWFVHAESTPRGTVLLLHGHNGCKESMLPLAALLAKEGYNSLACDSRGCGESTGQFCTFGYYEHRDCSRCLDELERRYGAELGPVAIYGNSFGGAVALQTMAVDPRIRCGVVESTFATLREIVRDYEQEWFGLRADAWADAALDRAGRLAHFPPDAVRPEDAAGQIDRPVLVIHGTADRNIACRYGERIFHHLRAPGSEWCPLPGASHHDLWQIGGDEYRRRVLAFLARNDH